MAGTSEHVKLRGWINNNVDDRDKIRPDAFGCPSYGPTMKARSLNEKTLAMAVAEHLQSPPTPLPKPEAEVPVMEAYRHFSPTFGGTYTSSNGVFHCRCCTSRFVPFGSATGAGPTRIEDVFQSWIEHQDVCFRSREHLTLPPLLIEGQLVIKHEEGQESFSSGLWTPSRRNSSGVWIWTNASTGGTWSGVERDTRTYAKNPAVKDELQVAFPVRPPGTFAAASGRLSCPCGHTDKANVVTALEVWLLHLQKCKLGVVADTFDPNVVREADDLVPLPLLAELIEIPDTDPPQKVYWTPTGRDEKGRWRWESSEGRRYLSTILDQDTGYANDPDVWRDYEDEEGEGEDYEERGGEDEVESEDEYGGVFPRARKMEQEAHAATRAAAREDGRLPSSSDEEALSFFDLRGKLLTNAVLEGNVAMWRHAAAQAQALKPGDLRLGRKFKGQMQAARASYDEELTRVFAEAGVPLTPSGIQACWEERFATVAVEDGLRARQDEATRLPLPGPLGMPPAPEVVWDRTRPAPAIDSPLLGHCARMFKQLADELQALKAERSVADAPEDSIRASYFSERESQLQTRMKTEREAHDKELTRLFAAGGIDIGADMIQRLWGQRLVALGKEAEKEVRAKSKTVNFAYAPSPSPAREASPLERRADRLLHAKANAHIIGSDPLIAEDPVLKVTAERWRSYKKGRDVNVALPAQTDETRARAEMYLKKMVEAHDEHQTHLRRLVEERYPALTSDLAVSVATLAVIWEQRTKHPAADVSAATVQPWSLAEQQRRWEQVLVQTAVDLYPAIDKAKAEAGAPVERQKFKSPMFVRSDPEQEPQKLKEPVMPIENETPIPTPTHPTLGLAIEGGKRGGKMILSVQAMRAVQSLVRKIAARYLPPEHLPLLDTPFGQAVVDMLSPLVIHALAEHGYLGEGKAKELTQATAEYAYEGQVVRHGLVLTDTMLTLTVDFAESFEEIRKIGMQLAQHDSPGLRVEPSVRTAAHAVSGSGRSSAS